MFINMTFLDVDVSVSDHLYLHPPPLAALAPQRGIVKKWKKYFRKKNFEEKKSEAEN